MNEWTGLVYLTTAALLGCSGGSPSPLSGQDDDADVAEAGPQGSFEFADAGGALQAHVVVNGDTNLVCGACAVLVAQATGGLAPYTYAWSDPSLAGAGSLTVCPLQSTRYSVTVTDSSGRTSGEIMTAAQTAMASAEVTCKPPALDAGPPDAAGLAGCVSTAAENVEDCPIVGDAGVSKIVSTRLVFDPVPGSPYEFTYNELLPIAIGAAVTVDVYGALEKCGQDQKLFTLTLDGRWNQSYCFTPNAAFRYATSVVHFNGTLYDMDFSQSGTDCAGCSLDAGP